MYRPKLGIRNQAIRIRLYLKSPLGKATALDHHINRPGYAGTDF